MVYTFFFFFGTVTATLLRFFAFPFIYSLQSSGSCPRESMIVPCLPIFRAVALWSFSKTYPHMSYWSNLLRYIQDLHWLRSIIGIRLLSFADRNGHSFVGISAIRSLSESTFLIAANISASSESCSYLFMNVASSAFARARTIALVLSAVRAS